MPRRTRRGYVTRPSNAKVNAYYKAAKTIGAIAANAGRINYVKGGSQPPKSTKFKNKMRIKADHHTLIGSTGKSISKYNSGKKKVYHKDVPDMLNYFNDKGLLFVPNAEQGYAVADYQLTSIDLEQWLGNNPDFSLSINNDKRAEVYIENITGQILFKNHSNVQVQMTLYDCVMKRNSKDSPLTLIANGTASRFNINPSVSTATHKLVGMQPSFSKYFTNHCKILGAKKLYIDPGSVHEHSYTVIMNKKFAVDDYFQEINNASIPYIGGMTRFVLVRIHGTPIVSTDGNTAGVSEAKMVWTSHCKVNYKILFSVKEKSAAYGTINTTTGQKTMGEDTDVITTVQSA